MMKPKLALLLGFAVLSAWASAQTQPAAGTTTPANVKVIGRLGQAVANVKMRVSMSSKARVISTAKAFQYLVINDSGYNAWKKVLLVDGRNAFIASDQVAVLPYDVTVPVGKSGSKLPPVRGGTQVAGSNAANWVVNASTQYIGTRYVWGGNSLTGGIDCSGFVKELYKQVGVNLPRTAREQAKVGKPITRLEDLQAGDRLYFWDKKRGYIGHTGIFLGYRADGGAYFIHSSTTNHGVDTDDLRNAKWRNMLCAVRR
jgi:cell wall-associated NlpC family hydrolase